MANGRQATAKRMKMAERAQQLMNLHFPNVDSSFIWHRKTNDGFTTIPRTLPIVMNAIDAQSKGQPAGHALFCLWARSPDNPVITIENPATFAGEAGFIGERATDTWRKRMKRLRELTMIMTKPGASGEFHYVMLLNPNAGLEWMRSHGLVQDGIYGRFIERLMEVGAYGEIEAVREFWVNYQTAQTAAAAAAQAASPQSAAPAETTAT
ncbi:hypothetical protein LUI11_25770 [Bradyrhizobium diazoefficiens]|uniref:Uncharacterized protein n=1 Tax=Bradyrhizobium diazoefficiens SEMIA 5080 TaxID=754504 RepID=A0A837C4H6_9BRAD|nr:hypothetical protein [Bradyrhizobium diazoefficiens]APO56480.1 hypothetical protein BD122_39340 [Bradyrhizobium diazoefficiens]KGJ63885.1 hypothetical protein BJA5080_05684 [Bradyrhizobium diazoefficiens SEMIA 5080]MCD9295476.1 hypothetical protein [Bradyrhizobium diazoefficiens]MCD9813849.1 hypothetical protein [Bradyrhizobium diazoefficiens]MCD9830566.1 hypothetical protein [Bradyrhizobium diazoefficiens]